MKKVQNANIDSYIIKDINSYKNKNIHFTQKQQNGKIYVNSNILLEQQEKPKGSMLTHGNWFTAIHNECDVLTLKQDDVFLGIIQWLMLVFLGEFLL